jgi:hypothetical protein
VARGMEIVNRLIDATGPCDKNQYGERHCYHWRGQPPTLRTRVQADCCWCGVTRTFDYVDVMEGRAPISVRPSSGAVHGTARDWLDQPTTHAMGRLSAKGAARDHAQKMGEAAANMGIRELAAIIARQRDALEEAHGLLDAWVHATKSQQVDADTGVGQAWTILGKALGKEAPTKAPLASAGEQTKESV